MQWYVDIVTISATGVLGWFALASLGVPIRALCQLRHDVLQQLLVLENITLPKPRELAVSSREINAYHQAVRNVREAQRTFHDLGFQLLAFVENEPAACSALFAIGLNVAEAGKRLVDLAMSYSKPATDRTDLRSQIKKALHSTDAAAATGKLNGGMCGERQRLTRRRSPFSLQILLARHDDRRVREAELVNAVALGKRQYRQTNSS